jgi:hypothetical protein
MRNVTIFQITRSAVRTSVCLPRKCKLETWVIAFTSPLFWWLTENCQRSPAPTVNIGRVARYDFQLCKHLFIAKFQTKTAASEVGLCSWIRQRGGLNYRLSERYILTCARWVHHSAGSGEDPYIKHFYVAHMTTWPRESLATLKANSHMPYSAHAVPLPCHAVPMPFSDSAVSFVKARMVAGNIRTTSPKI